MRDSNFPEDTSQRRQRFSCSPAPTRVLPSGDKAKAKTSPLNPSKVCSSLPEGTSQTQTTAGAPPPAASILLFRGPGKAADHTCFHRKPGRLPRFRVPQRQASRSTDCQPLAVGRPCHRPAIEVGRLDRTKDLPRNSVPNVHDAFLIARCQPVAIGRPSQAGSIVMSILVLAEKLLAASARSSDRKGG